MYKVYLKQAMQMLKQNKFFSLVYIFCTGLAIAMVMVLTIMYYFQTAGIAPEIHRNRMMFLKFGQIQSSSSFGTSSHSYSTIKTCFYPMKIPEAVCAILPLTGQNELIQKSGDKEIYKALVMGTDVPFWKIFRFSFISGSSYTEEEFTSGLRKAVLCESFALRLFQTTDAVGLNFTLNFEDYKVAGVVKDVPSIANHCYAQVWIPFTNRPEMIKGGEWCNGVLGPMHVYILAKNSSDFDAIRAEATQMCQKYNDVSTEYKLSLNDQPDTVIQSLVRTDSKKTPDFKKYYFQCLLILLIFLLIPSVNLTGMTSSRIKKRLEELGIHKAFGAQNKVLLFQIVYENMLLTLLGGAVGLLISFGIILTLKNWLLGNYGWNGDSLTASIDLTPGMLINPVIFGYTLLLCLILNILSVLIPVWKALRKPIIETLNDK